MHMCCAYALPFCSLRCLLLLLLLAPYGWQCGAPAEDAADLAMRARAGTLAIRALARHVQTCGVAVAMGAANTTNCVCIIGLVKIGVN